MKTVAKTRRPPEVFTFDEMQRILRACVPVSREISPKPHHIRTLAMVVCLWRSGMRLRECMDLQPRDLDLADGKINIRKAKRDKHRIVTIDVTACATIQRWADVRAQLNPPDGSPFFCGVPPINKLGDTMTSRQFQLKFRTVCRRAKVEKAARPHNLRHTYTFQARKEGISYLALKNQLGHTRLEQTVQYSDHLCPEDSEDLRWRVWELPGEEPSAEPYYDEIAFGKIVNNLSLDAARRILHQLGLAALPNLSIQETARYSESDLIAAWGFRPGDFQRARKSGTLKFFQQGREFWYLGSWILAWLEADAEARQVARPESLEVIGETA